MESIVKGTPILALKEFCSAFCFRKGLSNTYLTKQNIKWKWSWILQNFVGDVIFSLFQAITFIYTNFINFAAYPLPFRIEDYHLVDWIPMPFVCTFEESWLAFANFDLGWQENEFWGIAINFQMKIYNSLHASTYIFLAS